MIAAAWCGGSLAASLILMSRPVLAQEALRSSLAGDAAAEARRVQPESLPYNFKSGDFRLLVTPSVGLDWNDNINTSKDNAEEDFILRPLVGLTASYPLTQRNLLQLNVTFGYNNYFQHDELSTWYVQSGSELSFDIYVKDFWINFHDRFSYVQDSAQQAAVANTGNYGTFQNTVGLNTTWDLEDVTLSLGYDHQDVLSTSQQFQSTDHASEMLLARAGFRFQPRLTAGLEGTVSWTAYHQPVLNNNTAYSAGIYADWQPGSYFHAQPRVGYVTYQFQQTSQSSFQTSDLNSWYADLTITHQITDAVSYTLSGGHEIRLGIQQADAIEDSYVRPGIIWNIFKDLRLQTYLSYEHGQQGVGNVTGNLTETYGWLGGGLALSYPIMKRLTAGLNYRLTLRSSTNATREYTQNLVEILLTYHTL